MNDYLITSDSIKNYGYEFSSQSDAEIFLNFIHDEYLHLIGEKAAASLSRPRLKQLLRLINEGNEKRIGSFLQRKLPNYPELIEEAWNEINRQLLENRCQVEQSFKQFNSEPD